ncbi:MAG: hypothetical protein WC061_08140 [Melioribacteraceae bacterium]
MPALKVFIPFNPLFGVCPECSRTGTLHKSRSRTMTEQIIRRVTFFRTYRCKECGWRGYRSTIITTKKSYRTIAVYLLLIAFTAVIARFIISRFVSV